MWQRQILALGPIDKLKDSIVCIFGCGGLGCSAALHCALSGIKNIILIDYDVIDVTNIHRQICFTHNDIGKNKIDVCKQFILDRCPEVNIKTFKHYDDSLHFDIVVECTDSIRNKLFWNTKCKQLKIPYIFGAAIKTYGFVACFNFKNQNSPCLKCCFPHFEQGESNCSIKGIWGVISNLIGTMQSYFAVECILNSNYETKAYLCQRGEFINFQLQKECECDKVVNDTVDNLENEDIYVPFDIKYLTDTMICFDIREHIDKVYDRCIHYTEENIETIIDACKHFKTVYVLCEKGEKSLDIVLNIRNKGYKNIFVFLLN